MGKIILGILVLALGFVAAIFIASNQGGEVVTIHTQDERGAELSTPLWVVDSEGAQYLRAGNKDSSWCNRLRANPSVAVERAGVTKRYEAVFAPEVTPQIEALMAEKYGLADKLIGVIRRPGQSVAIRLVPAAS